MNFLVCSLQVCLEQLHLLLQLGQVFFVVRGALLVLLVCLRHLLFHGAELSLQGFRLLQHRGALLLVLLDARFCVLKLLLLLLEESGYFLQPAGHSVRVSCKLALDGVYLILLVLDRLVQLLLKAGLLVLQLVLVFVGALLCLDVSFLNLFFRRFQLQLGAF